MTQGRCSLPHLSKHRLQVPGAWVGCSKSLSFFKTARDCPLSFQEPNVAFQTDEHSTQGALTAISQGMWTGVQLAARELTPRHTDELMERRAAWMRTSGAQRLAERSQTSYADYVAACDDARLDLVRKEVFSSQDSIHTRLRAWSSLVAASHLWLPSNRYCS